MFVAYFSFSVSYSILIVSEISFSIKLNQLLFLELDEDNILILH